MPARYAAAQATRPKDAAEEACERLIRTADRGGPLTVDRARASVAGVSSSWAATAARRGR